MFLDFCNRFFRSHEFIFCVIFLMLKYLPTLITLGSLGCLVMGVDLLITAKVAISGVSLQHLFCEILDMEYKEDEPVIAGIRIVLMVVLWIASMLCSNFTQLISALIILYSVYSVVSLRSDYMRWL